MPMRRLLLLFLCSAWPAFSAPLSIEEVSLPASVTQLVISPDSKHLAAIVRTGYFYGLAVMDTETLNGKIIFGGGFVREGALSFVKSPIGVEWAGNDLLAVDFGIQAESLNLKGEKVKELGQAIIGSAEPDKKDSLLKLVYTDTRNGEVAVVNARTGEWRDVSHPRGKPIKWAFDRQGQPRAVSVINSAFWKDVSTVSNWYRASPSSEWEKLEEFSVKEDYWLPLFAPDKPGKLIVRSRAGRDTYALFEYDTLTRKTETMLAGDARLDVLAADGLEDGDLRRVVTGGMMPKQIWLAPDWAKVQSMVDAELPGRINILSGDLQKSVLIHSYSDVDPGSWFLLNMPDLTMREVARRYLRLDSGQMRPKEVISYRAADGLSIPAYLTRPAEGKGPWPTVIFIHGGPVARDNWAWDPEVQLLASRGYAVLQPQFRGSSGFGREFELAGYGQWGLAMQDDVTAGVQHLISEGIADRARICIHGASYGGYAALWGLVKTPELYRCGVSFAGVSDIEEMWSDWSDTMFNKVAREVMASRVGDVKVQADKFAELSPVRHAGRIHVPVLIMHGDEDWRVPIGHGKRMKKALEKNSKDVEWVEFVGEGHGLRYTKNQQRYYEALLGFLHRQIGGLPP